MRSRLPIVLSLTALIVAVLGSTPVGEAAMSALPRASVGTAQLQNNSVTSAKVRNRSLLAVDFRRGQLPRGPQGPAGPPGLAGPVGPQGPAGLAGLEPVFATSVVNSSTTRTLAAVCPSGKAAVGGGAAIGPTNTAGVAITSSYLATPTRWTAAAREINSTTANWGLNVVVICATVP